jgi:peptide deformylase
MAKLPILIAPHATLKKVAAPVETVDDRVRQLMDDMLETMYDAPGVGLAAPQVGILERVVVIDVANTGETPQPHKLVNPEVIWHGEELVDYEEGCLSLPDIFAEVTRPNQVRVRYRDETDAERTLDAEGMLATVIQHEIDHLNGVLFVDHLSHLKRNILMKKLSKQMQKSGKPRYAAAAPA